MYAKAWNLPLDNLRDFICIAHFNSHCYDMEVGENRVRVFYGTEKREGKEKDSRYMGETSAPAAVTVYQIYNISPAQVYL